MFSEEHLCGTLWSRGHINVTDTVSGWVMGVKSDSEIEINTLILSVNKEFSKKIIIMICVFTFLTTLFKILSPFCMKILQKWVTFLTHVIGGNRTSATRGGRLAWLDIHSYYHPFISVTARRSVDTCDDKVVSEYEEGWTEWGLDSAIRHQLSLVPRA